MRKPHLECLHADPDGVRILHVLAPCETTGFSPISEYADYLRENGFNGREGDFALIPGREGAASAVFVCSEDFARDPARFGALALELPLGKWRPDVSSWPSERRETLIDTLVLGFCMGAYRFTLPENPGRDVRLAIPHPPKLGVKLAEALWLGRDLINMPANILGPEELASRAVNVLERGGAQVKTYCADALKKTIRALPRWVRARNERPTLLRDFGKGVAQMPLHLTSHLLARAFVLTLGAMTSNRLRR